MAGPNATHIEAARTGLPAARDALHQQPALTTLRQAIAAVDEQRQALVEAGDLHNLAHGLAQIGALVGDIRQLQAAVEADVAGLMVDKKVEIDGLGVIERRRGTDRKAWDWPSLLPLLIRSEVDPEGTGELPAAPVVVDAITRVIVDVIGVTPSKGPKITGLRARGLDPDEWAETSPGRVSVQIHADLKSAS